MCTIESFVCGDVRASEFVWDSLWRCNKNSFVKFNILDTVQIVSGKISRWLFTSSEGYVKRKSRSRWTLDGMRQRCAGTNSDQCSRANISGTSQLLEWKVTDQSYGLNLLFETEEYSESAAILYGHVHGHFSYFEATYEIATGVLSPKFTTFSLCGSMAKGSQQVDSRRSIPSAKIQSLNKDMNALTKLSLTDLVSIVESRKNVKVLKITVLFMCESSSDLSVGSRDKRVLWLHHTKELITTPKIVQFHNNSAATVNSDLTGRLSTTSSAVIYNISNCYRTAKCVGDFCKFSPKEELKYVNSSSELFFISPPRVIEGKIFSTETEASGGETTVEATSNDVMHGPDDISVCNSSDMFDCDTPMRSQAKYIKYKSICLARQDMADMSASSEDIRGRTVRQIWSNVLQNWWWRVGQHLISWRLEKFKSKSSDTYDGEGSTRAVTGSSSNELTGKKDGNGIKGVKESKSLPLNDDGMPHSNHLDITSSSRISFNQCTALDSNSIYDDKSCGRISLYYSDAKVCETCYNAYKDIDYNRRKYQNKMLSKANLLNMNADAEELEKTKEKARSQKLFGSRMSHLQSHKELFDYTGFCLQKNDQNFRSVEITDSNIFKVKQKLKKNTSVDLSLPIFELSKEKKMLLNYHQLSSSFVRNISAKAKNVRLNIDSNHYTTELSSEKKNIEDDVRNEWDHLIRKYTARIVSEERSAMGFKKSKSRVTLASTMEVKKSGSSRLSREHQQALLTPMQATVKTFDNNNVSLNIIRNRRLQSNTEIMVKRKTDQRRKSEPHGQRVQQTLMTCHSLTLPPLHHDMSHTTSNSNSSRSSNCNSGSTVSNHGYRDGTDNKSLPTSSQTTLSLSSRHFVDVLEDGSEMAVQGNNRRSSAFSVPNSNLESHMTSQKRSNILHKKSSSKRIVTFLDAIGSTSPLKIISTDVGEYGCHRRHSDFPMKSVTGCLSDHFDDLHFASEMKCQEFKDDVHENNQEEIEDVQLKP